MIRKDKLRKERGFKILKLRQLRRRRNRDGFREIRVGVAERLKFRENEKRELGRADILNKSNLIVSKSTIDNFIREIS